MKLLALLIVLGAEHVWPFGKYVRHDGWFAAIQYWMDHNVLASSWRYGCTVIIPAFVVALIIWILKNQWWGIIGVLLHIVVLFYVVGRGQLTQAIENYLSDWRTGDLQGAAHQAQLNFDIDHDDIADGIELHHAMRDRVLYYGLTDFFVVVFWYLVLGIFGALVSCLTKLYVNNATGDAKQWSQQALQIIEWLPSRLLGLTFAVAGNFGTCFGEWAQYISKTKMDNIDFLSVCGISAIGVTDIVDTEHSQQGDLPRDYLYKAEQEIRALLALIDRSRYVWFAIVAVAVVLGWL